MTCVQMSVCHPKWADGPPAKQTEGGQTDTTDKQDKPIRNSAVVVQIRTIFNLN